jgi:tetratricopeptide (TPR) repeat protein
MTERQKLCFVIMGFGKKPDFASGRTLDLDATYDAIIEPAVEEQGLRCIRGDKVLRSGVIDRAMYEMLLRADLVIADISTANVNAVYELGVRHALRPNSTIIMKEQDGKLYFDLDHVRTFHYEHLGPDIGVREATRAKRELGKLIAEVIAAGEPDSPVYTFLPKLRQPSMSDEDFADVINEAEAAQERLVTHVKAGETAMKESRHADAVAAFKAAHAMKPGDPFVVQQLALATYKSEKPSKITALVEALQIISTLSPSTSNDPETLGIAGALHKRMYQVTSDEGQLDLAIHHYRRGFEIRRDYYNGENLAACFDLRAGVQRDPAEAQYDRMSARKVREAIIEILTEAQAEPSFEERSDRRWVYATLANCSYALGRREEGDRFEALFRAENPAIREIETYEEGKARLGGEPAVESQVRS